MASDEQADFSSQPDFMFGVCEAIGEELGFDPFYMRVALLGLLLFSPVAMIASYLVLSGAVALSRLLFPRPDANVSRAVPDIAVTADLAPAERSERELVAA